jgi:hypothetical protein
MLRPLNRMRAKDPEGRADRGGKATKNSLRTVPYCKTVRSSVTRKSRKKDYKRYLRMITNYSYEYHTYE